MAYSFVRIYLMTIQQRMQQNTELHQRTETDVLLSLNDVHALGDMILDFFSIH